MTRTRKVKCERCFDTGFAPVLDDHGGDTGMGDFCSCAADRKKDREHERHLNRLAAKARR